MTAFVTVTAGAGVAAEAALSALEAALAEAGVLAGLDRSALGQLASALEDEAFESTETVLARGTPAEPGRDGRVEVAFEQGLSAGSVSADGHMNFLERQLLKSVPKGQLLAQLHAPVAAQVGTTVDGRALTARAGSAATLVLGAGVVVDDQGVVRAERDGVVLYKPGGALEVVDRHVHEGAVNLHSGHLEMQGSLMVKGDVERLLQVRASGDIEVLGSVSGSLRAGGSIKVSGSVCGGDEARVVAGADATLKSCEAADVTASGTLRVQEAVNSQLAASTLVVAGRMRGGRAQAELSVTVKEAGTSSGTTTVLEAGEPLTPPDLEQVQRAVVMQKLRRMAERGGVRDAFGSRGDSRGKGGKLGRLDAALSQEELEELAVRAERRAQLQRSAFLELGLGHAGVELRIGAARLMIEQTVRGTRYVRDPETGQLKAEGIER